MPLRKIKAFLNNLPTKHELSFCCFICLAFIPTAIFLKLLDLFKRK